MVLSFAKPSPFDADHCRAVLAKPTFGALMFGTGKLSTPARGYGFIVSDAPSQQSDIFYHIKSVVIPAGRDQKQIEALLKPGVRVEYELGEGRDGRSRAVRVEVLELKMTDLHGNDVPVGRYSGFVDGDQ